MRSRRVLSTIDTHTAGGPTRTLMSGIPLLEGDSVAEKMAYFQEHLDSVRKLLMHEPRGHRDMSGAVITQPSDPEADIGVFFITGSGYLPACVHSSIGVATAGLETGFLQVPRDRTDGGIRMETPSGLVTLFPRGQNGSISSIALRTPPAFVHTASATLELEGHPPLEVTLAFSGVFFLLLDVGLLDLPTPSSGSPIQPENAGLFSDLGARVLEAANQAFQVHHPDHPQVNSIALVMFYQEEGEGRGRDIVISTTGGVDRSPCGAGTGAKVAYLFGEGRLGVGDDYLIESFLGTRFTGRVLRPATVGPFQGVEPEIEGQAFITGMHRFTLDPADPMSEGFVF